MAQLAPLAPVQEGPQAARAAAAASPASATPAGWYADAATGRQRYWDGIHWTEHYGPAPNLYPPPEVPYAVPLAAVGPGKSSKATWSLVLGILGILVIPIVFSLLAIIFGVSARGEIDRDPRIQGRGNATAGIVLGVIGLGGWALILMSAGA